MGKLSNTSNGTVIQVKNADSFLKRFSGLMGKPAIGQNEGLFFILEKPSRINAGIHMLFMRFDIAVIWLSPELKVVDKALAKKWHLSYMPEKPAKYYLETHQDQLENFAIDDQIEITT